MKNKALIAMILFLCVIGAFAIFNGKEAEPMSAAGMSTNDRADNDSAVILEEVKSEGPVKSVEIQYENDAIIVRLDVPNTAQHIESTADSIVDTVKGTLDERRADLTLDKDKYFIYVYGSNNRLINAPT